MKKRLIIRLVCSAAALLTVILGVYFGMGFLNKNNLTCSSNNKANGVNISQNYSIKFENNIINNITIDKKYIYEDQNRFDKFSSIVAKGNDANMASLQNDYVKFSSSTKNKTYTTSLKVDAKNASKESMAKVGLDKNLNVIKESLIEQGLSCN